MDIEEEPEDPNMSSLDEDMEDVAEKYASSIHCDAEYPDLHRINVRDVGGNVHEFDVIVEYEPTFSARTRRK